MEAGVYDMVCAQGATFSEEFTITQDLSDCTIRGMVRKTSTAATPLATFTTTLTAGLESSVFTVSLTDEQTDLIPATGAGHANVSQYWYDIEALYPDGHVNRLLNGAFTVSPSQAK